MSLSSPNLRKVLGILTATADIDACVIQRVRLSVSSPNLRIMFGIVRSGKALLRTKYIYLHQPSMVSSNTIVSICINLSFLYACQFTKVDCVNACFVSRADKKKTCHVLGNAIIIFSQAERRRAI